MDIGRFLIDSEAAIRFAAFAAVFALMAAWEVLAPRRALTLPKGRRWAANLGVTLLNVALVRVLFPTATVGMALAAESRQWGLFNALPVPAPLAFVASFLVLDLVIWIQHIAFHRTPLLARLHRMHHVDLDFDVTTGLRFHPVEILLSLMVKFAAVMALGAPAAAVLAFELALNLGSLFNHGNVRMPGALDRALRLLVVTPDMHRVHHSIVPEEINSNFGFFLSWWDRLFGTYRAAPRAGHDGITIGVRDTRDPAVCARLAPMLALPFRERADDFPCARPALERSTTP
ncbi:MAG TPA: sterol desaturase family protein [Burkholderiales bacterium]|jgi:sterol desaturase/sphingolipid hydroxylase (fatty acid hydroxylase superfamily)